MLWKISQSNNKVHCVGMCKRRCTARHNDRRSIFSGHLQAVARAWWVVRPIFGSRKFMVGPMGSMDKCSLFNWHEWKNQAKCAQTISMQENIEAWVNGNSLVIAYFSGLHKFMEGPMGWMVNHSFFSFPFFFRFLYCHEQTNLAQICQEDLSKSSLQ